MAAGGTNSAVETLRDLQRGIPVDRVDVPVDWSNV